MQAPHRQRSLWFETEVERVTKLIEPVMLVMMGVIIAAVVLALYLPLFELTSVVGG